MSVTRATLPTRASARRQGEDPCRDLVGVAAGSPGGPRHGRMWQGGPVEALPSGTVTFLFTDIVGSTRRWELEGAQMARVLARHDEILASAVQADHGRVVKHTGDGLLVG
jgi:class 3 adenylate cyclase